MNRCLTILALGIGLLCTVPLVKAADIQLTLIPSSGPVSGAPGSTVGWGYSLTNNTSEWIEPLAVSADNFTNGTPNVIFDYPDVAPNSTVSLAFSLPASPSCSSAPCGLYDLVWDASAPLGATDNGTFTVSSDFFSGDPSNPASVDLGPASDANATYSAVVSSTPEPSSFLIALAGLFVLCKFARRTT